jgi:hypothetical protein
MGMTSSGVEAGRFDVSAGVTVVDASLSFACVSGPRLAVRREVTRPVTAGC